ncbi:MAG: polysaccharide deacetylase family protein [Clostridiales bacterium]|nr:polysaccharide deacetylase family protein [Clostridiales bacterium]
MKKTSSRLLLLTMMAVLIIGNILDISALSTKPLDWYAKRTKDHTHPPIDNGLRIIEKYNAYYLDKTKSDPSSEKVIYLTFDAGYENGNIAKILDTLQKHNAHAAFFILGHLITKETELVRRMANEGHVVANHTNKHRDMSKYTDLDSFSKELSDLEKIYRQHIGGEMAKFYRPPEGRFSEMNLKFADELGYKTIFWSFAYADWDNNKQVDHKEAIDKILKHTHNGAIILLHPTSATNAAIIDELLTEWKAQGYRFGSLYELE